MKKYNKQGGESCGNRGFFRDAFGVIVSLLILTWVVLITVIGGTTFVGKATCSFFTARGCLGNTPIFYGNI